MEFTETSLFRKEVQDLPSHSEENEHNLIQRARDGNHIAFRKLFDDNVDRVYALCFRMCTDEDTADELTQNVFIRAWEKISTFKHESKFSTWLHRIAVNQFLMMKRSEKRTDGHIDRIIEIHKRENSPQRERYHFDTNIDLEYAISLLPDRMKTAFILHDIEGYKHEEICEIMNIETGTSKAHLHKARKLIREALTK